MERLEQLIREEQALVMKLQETRFLIQGYKNAQQEQEGKEEQEEKEENKES